MSLFSYLLAIIFSVQLIALILFVVFGEMTVRKLRKNPTTKNALGIEFISGWDILNVASALALPKKVAHILKNSPLSVMRADPDALYKYTTQFDRILAKIIYSLLVSTVLAMLILIFLNKIGALK
jgi:hypothetical protein